jgi:hypothetical protein
VSVTEPRDDLLAAAEPEGVAIMMVVVIAVVAMPVE